jgi:ABC-type oligopeptide transport system ATPase subunit
MVCLSLQTGEPEPSLFENGLLSANIPQLRVGKALRELGYAATFFDNPIHCHTQALMWKVVGPEKEKKKEEEVTKCEAPPKKKRIPKIGLRPNMGVRAPEARDIYSAEAARAARTFA